MPAFEAILGRSDLAAIRPRTVGGRRPRPSSVRRT